MKKFHFKILGQKYHVIINNYENDIVDISVNGTNYEVVVQTEKKETQKTPNLVRKLLETKPGQERIQKNNAGSYQIKAPLPGNIFKILVSEGDEIKNGDNLLIMEAMKMENNITTEKGGTVKSIKIKEGDNVLQGDILIEID